MRNTLAPTVQVELFREGSETPAVLGTDCVIGIDGRWSQARANRAVREYGQAEAEKRGLEWRNTVYLIGRYRSELI